MLDQSHWLTDLALTLDVEQHLHFEFNDILPLFDRL
jgi:hypothetical protein